MKVFITIAACFLLTASAVVCTEDTAQKMRSSYGGGSPGYSAPAPPPQYSAPAPPPPPPSYAPPAPPPSVSIPAPPCPKNYLFSCQPSLTPAPCSPPASGGYGSSGAYSQNYPMYAPLSVGEYIRALNDYQRGAY